MNSSTLEITRAGTWRDDPSPPADGFLKFHRELGKREILTAFRFLVFLATLVLLFSSGKGRLEVFDLRMALLLSAYLLSIVGVSFLASRWFENQILLAMTFVTDIFFVTAGIYLGGIHDVDLFVIFFITIFISALSQNVQSVFTISAVACALYAFLQLKSGRNFLADDTEALVRFPFLFVAAALSGYLAMESKKHKEERERLKYMNDFLAGQADSSTLKLAETYRNLKSLLEYHHCVLSSVKIGIIVARKSGIIRTFNSGARQITGFIEAEMAGKSLEELPVSLAPVSAALRRTLEEEKTFVQEHLELKTPRHETVPVTLETSLLKGGNGETIGAIAVLRDMTLLRQMETQLLRAERFSALGEMAAGVAHEIKNPLNAIMGFSRRLSAKLQDPGLKKYADIMVEEVIRMDGIVNDVLEYSRPDQVHKEPCDVNRILEETAEFLREKFEETGIILERDFDPVLVPVPLDLPKIRQVVLNLMLNAAQAIPTERPGARIILRTRITEGILPENTADKGDGAIFQQLFLHQKMVAISVADNGSGIPKENLSKLFHPFFTTKTTGTGLGLSICQKIVASHGGTLDVESELGKGSRFTLYLPLEDD